jgi:hypothetical protein
MKKWTLALALLVSFAARVALAQTEPLITINPNCEPEKISKANIEITFCQAPEKMSHYPTEIRFTRGGKALFNYTLLSDPTGGYASAEVLGADERFVLLQLEGDENNHLIAFDLTKKAPVFNTGVVNGMGLCELKTLNEKPFCNLWVMCPMPTTGDERFTTGISEYLCPDGK